MQNEYQRLLAVNRFKQFTEGIRQDLDAVADLMAQICEVPVALVTIIDDKTQWFTAKRGVEIDCNKREYSFCNTTIAQPDLLIVPDAQRDERFAELPVVKNEPHIRFYAGAALHTYDGHAVGSLCVLDVKPRNLNDLQKNALRTLARQVVNVLELNWSLRNLAEQYDGQQAEISEAKQQAALLDAAFNTYQYPQVLLNTQYKITAFNQAAAAYINEHYHTPLEKGRSLITYISEDKGRYLAVFIDKAMAGYTHQVLWQHPFMNSSDALNVSFTPMRRHEGNIMGVMIKADKAASPLQP
jgi:hypothetical protein